MFSCLVGVDLGAGREAERLWNWIAFPSVAGIFVWVFFAATALKDRGKRNEEWGDKNERKGKKRNISYWYWLTDMHRKERERERSTLTYLYLNLNLQVKMCWLLLNPYRDFETLKPADTLWSSNLTFLNSVWKLYPVIPGMEGIIPTMWVHF